jgi:type II secretory pathway pseudopilin PulG
MTTFGINGPSRAALYLAIVAVVGAIAAWRLSQARSRRRARQAAETPVLTEPVTELAGNAKPTRPARGYPSASPNAHSGRSAPAVSALNLYQCSRARICSVMASTRPTASMRTRIPRRR